ncbi:hypothetical protein [Georgenia thermotolerans]|uniref:DUF4267 domain-containing protein n=1 Tax=Georgenia thermotolerans TaxID=527326 RepID=A0A7J5URA4_9MICO|nr:hypothetical protein [Georgenia thermotolerans]KAE8764857.1 hypothetical protein GB883_06970 [Georgenia thermotolerans]
MSWFAAVRAGYGAGLLFAPDLIVTLGTGHRPDPRTTAVARVLGARHLVQAAGTAGTPGRAVLALGAEADLVHGASMLLLAAWDRTRARTARTDAAAALSFALAGALLARHAPSTPQRPPRGGGVLASAAAWREAAAARLGRWLLPASLRQARD